MEQEDPHQSAITLTVPFLFTTAIPLRHRHFLAKPEPFALLWARQYGGAFPDSSVRFLNPFERNAKLAQPMVIPSGR